MSIPGAFPFPAGASYQQEHGTRDSQNGRLPGQASLSSPSLPTPDADFDLLSPTIHDPTTQHIIPSIQSPPAMTNGLPFISPGVQSPYGALSYPEQHAFAVGLPSSLPMPMELPTPPEEEPQRLRLPSFDLLGIANPYPDRILPLAHKPDTRNIGQASSLPWSNDLLIEEPSGGNELGYRDHSDSQMFDPESPPRLSFPPDPSILTPPDEPALFDWDEFCRLHTALPSQQLADQPEPDNSHVLDFSNPATRPTTSSGDPHSSFSRPRITMTQAAEAYSVLEKRDLETICHSIISQPTAGAFASELKVLSHALPIPRIPGHTYPQIIELLRTRLPSSPLTWMSLLHAVPGRYNLSDLPMSPPSTPAPAMSEAEDYFTTRVFAGPAVQITDYAAGDEAQSLAGSDGPGNALAPPCTINLTIVERYIPPSSSNEFRHMFSISRPSLLVDRLIELVPGNGHLLFIYPTRAGAIQFLQSYLGPIVDPLMRQNVVLYNFSADLARSIGTMEAVREMMSFDTLRFKVQILCEDMGKSDDPAVRRRLYGNDGVFSLVYAQQHHIELNRQVWADWWVKQEKQRIRASVDREFRRPNRARAEGSSITPRAVVQEILADVGGGASADGSERPYREYQEGQDPTGKKIEVGVFVIRRERRG